MLVGRFHHLGVAVADIEKSLPFYRDAMGYALRDGPYHDPIQKVHVCFLIRRDSAGTPVGPNANDPAGSPLIELISPAAEDAPVNSYLRKEVGAYHLCFEVDGMAAALADLRSKRCVLVAGPAPAVAFGGRHIAWVFTPTRQLIELLSST